MSTADYSRSLRRRRAALLAGAAGTALAVAVLYFVGRRAGEAPPPLRGAAATDPAQKMIGEGYDYTVTEGDKPLFRVRGGRIVQSVEGGVELLDVALTLFRAEGGEYLLRGERATYDPGQRAARVNGHVVLTGPRRLRLETEALELAPGGRRLASEKGVSLSFEGGFQARAQSLRADLRDESFVLLGGVVVRGRPETDRPVVLTAERVLVESASGLVHAEGKARLRHGRDAIAAGRLAARLNPEGELEFVRARFGVEGRFRAPGVDSDRTRLRAESMTLILVGGEPRNVELHGWTQAPARVESVAATGSVFAMESPYMSATFASGELANAEILEGATFSETAAGSQTPLRKATSRRGQIVFEQGEAVAMSLAKHVVLEEEGRRVLADQGIMDLRSKRANFEGRPAVATTDRGELRAPRLAFQGAAGLLLASGGVQSTVSPEAAALLAESGFAANGGPIRVDSMEASLQERPRSATFLGRVRAWRGSEVLVADQLRLDEAASALTASGAVKSLWRPPAEPDPGQPAPEPIEITADNLVYGAQRLTYQGAVTASQGPRRLHCDEATIELDEDKRARRILGRGHAILEEGSGQRLVTGDSLDYDLVAKLVTVRGEPVIVLDPVRGRAEGRVVVYDVTSGAMRLSAADANPPGLTGS